MKHEEIRHKLSEFIDGAVTPGDKAAIDQHLNTCSECADALRELRKTIENIHAIEEVESPAWMTQKIMAKVREEHEAKNSLWQRVFAPLLVKFPIQAVAVLFLSVSAFYIYTTMHPAEKYSEAPMERFAKQEAQDGSRDAQKQKAPEIAERRENKVAQGPEYKSLDMKYEYEKPAPPVPQEQPAASAPAPAKRDAPMYAQDKADLEKRAASPKANAIEPSLMAEQAALSAGATNRVKTKSESTEMKPSLQDVESKPLTTLSQSARDFYPVPDRYFHLVIDKDKKLIAKWYMPGSDLPPGEMYFYSNGLLIVKSHVFSRFKEERYFLFDHRFSLDKEKLSLTITFIDNRIDFKEMIKVEQWQLEHKPADLSPILAIDLSNKNITYKIYSDKNYKKGIFFFGVLFADMNKK